MWLLLLVSLLRSAIVLKLEEISKLKNVLGDSVWLEYLNYSM